MAVKTYMDDSLLAADSTLIRCSMAGESVTVPSRAGDLQITAAGRGAIIARDTRHLTLEDGYIRLNNVCIIADKELMSVEVPASVMEIEPGFVRSAALNEIILHQQADEHTADQLQAASFRLKGRQAIFIPALTGTRVLENISTAAAVLGPPLCALNENMRVLFVWDDRSDIVTPRPCYDLTGRAGTLDEYTAVMDMIREGAFGWQHPQAERQSDYRIKTNGMHGHWGELSIALTSASALKPGAQEQLTVRLTKHKLFTPRLLPVRSQGRQYYLYSRDHLVANQAAPYWREDVGVFDRDGLVTDQKISEAVYAKARLLMFL